MRVLVANPPAAIVSLATAKEHLRVVTNDEDALITGYIAAAQSSIDGPRGWLGRSIVSQTLELRVRTFDRTALLPYGPVQSIASVKYDDLAGAEQTVAAETYELSEGALALRPGAAWPTPKDATEAVRIRYVAGYEAVPQAVVQAVLLLVGQWYRNRSAINVGTIVSSLPNGVEALLSPYRNLAG